MSLLSPEAEPDEIERPTHAHQEADQGEVASAEKVVSGPADATPEEQPRDQIAEDRPEGVLFATVIAGFVGHAAMVDEL